MNPEPRILKSKPQEIEEDVWKEVEDLDDSGSDDWAEAENGEHIEGGYTTGKQSEEQMPVETDPSKLDLTKLSPSQRFAVTQVLKGMGVLPPDSSAKTNDDDDNNSDDMTVAQPGGQGGLAKAKWRAAIAAKSRAADTAAAANAAANTGLSLGMLFSHLNTRDMTPQEKFAMMNQERSGDGGGGGRWGQESRVGVGERQLEDLEDYAGLESASQVGGWGLGGGGSMIGSMMGGGGGRVGSSRAGENGESKMFGGRGNIDGSVTGGWVDGGGGLSLDDERQLGTTQPIRDGGGSILGDWGGPARDSYPSFTIMPATGPSPLQERRLGAGRGNTSVPLRVTPALNYGRSMHPSASAHPPTRASRQGRVPEIILEEAKGNGDGTNGEGSTLSLAPFSTLQPPNATAPTSGWETIKSRLPQRPSSVGGFFMGTDDEGRGREKGSTFSQAPYALPPPKVTESTSWWETIKSKIPPRPSSVGGFSIGRGGEAFGGGESPRAQQQERPQPQDDLSDSWCQVSPTMPIDGGFGFGFGDSPTGRSRSQLRGMTYSTSMNSGKLHARLSDPEGRSGSEDGIIGSPSLAARLFAHHSVMAVQNADQAQSSPVSARSGTGFTRFGGGGSFGRGVGANNVRSSINDSNSGRIDDGRSARRSGSGSGVKSWKANAQNGGTSPREGEAMQ